MAKVSFKPGNMLYPLPAVMVSVTDGEGNDNIVTVAWTGTVCTNPPMAYISVRPERHSYQMIEKTGEFVINLTTEDLCFATDFCGVRSGKDLNKFEEMHLTKEKAQVVSAPLIAESPLNIECKVREKRELGSHTMFIADVVAVNADDRYMNEKGTFDLNASQLMVYSHGNYFGLGEKIGKFGYSVDKRNKDKKNAVHDHKKSEHKKNKKSGHGTEQKTMHKGRRRADEQSEYRDHKNHMESDNHNEHKSKQKTDRKKDTDRRNRQTDRRGDFKSDRKQTETNNGTNVSKKYRWK